MIKLDFGRPHGLIYGHAQAKYEQNGILFNDAGDPVDASPGILADSAVGQTVSKRDAVEFLRALLADRPVQVSQIQVASGKAGYGWRTVQRAKATIGAVAVKDGRGAWFWKAATKSAKSS